jgi:hypothetical protein
VNVSEKKIRELCQELEAEISWYDFGNDNDYKGSAYVTVNRNKKGDTENMISLIVERGGVNVYGHVWLDTYAAWIEKHAGKLRICTERDMRIRGDDNEM